MTSREAKVVMGFLGQLSRDEAKRKEMKKKMVALLPQLNQNMTKLRITPPLTRESLDEFFGAIDMMKTSPPGNYLTVKNTRRAFLVAVLAALLVSSTWNARETSLLAHSAAAEHTRDIYGELLLEAPTRTKMMLESVTKKNAEELTRLPKTIDERKKKEGMITKQIADAEQMIQRLQTDIDIVQQCLKSLDFSTLPPAIRQQMNLSLLKNMLAVDRIEIDQQVFKKRIGSAATATAMATATTKQTQMMLLPSLVPLMKNMGEETRALMKTKAEEWTRSWAQTPANIQQLTMVSQAQSYMDIKKETMAGQHRLLASKKEELVEYRRIRKTEEDALSRLYRETKTARQQLVHSNKNISKYKKQYEDRLETHRKEWKSKVPEGFKYSHDEYALMGYSVMVLSGALVMFGTSFMDNLMPTALEKWVGETAYMFSVVSGVVLKGKVFTFAEMLVKMSNVHVSITGGVTVGKSTWDEYLYLAILVFATMRYFWYHGVNVLKYLLA
jgi:hypothetical protein